MNVSMGYAWPFFMHSNEIRDMRQYFSLILVRNARATSFEIEI